LAENPNNGDWAQFVRDYGAYTKTATTGWVAAPVGNYFDKSTGIYSVEYSPLIIFFQVSFSLSIPMVLKL
jgi:hypothetical protein